MILMEDTISWKDNAMTLTVVPYNPHWPNLFEKEAVLISNALGNNCVALHHVGSTAVPGLCAKPKIDILAVVTDPRDIKEALQACGMTYRGEYNIPFHYGFSKRGEVDVNLHVYEIGHPEIELNLLFRDYLRASKEARDAYGKLKETLLDDESSFEKHDSPFTQYTLRKGDFIRQLLKQAGFERLRFMKCNDESEWKAARHYRQTYFFDKVPISDPYTWTFNHPDHVHFVLYQGWQIIGYAHIQLWPEKRAALRIIVLDESKRAHGSGGQFLTMIERWLKAQGYTTLHTESSPQACSFYKKYGYGPMAFDDPDNHPTDPNDTPMGKQL